MNRHRTSRLPSAALVVLLAASLAGCGPLVAQALRTSEGVKGSSVAPGPGAPPKAGARLAILSPFAKTKDSFYVCKGEDEEALAGAFRDGAVFDAAAVQSKDAASAAAKAEEAKAIGPAKAREALALPFEPDRIVTGTILSRRTIVSPFRGVIMDVSYRLTFADPRGGEGWTVEVAVRTPAEEVPRAVAGEVARLAGAGR